MADMLVHTGGRSLSQGWNDSQSTGSDHADRVRLLRERVALLHAYAGVEHTAKHVDALVERLGIAASAVAAEPITFGPAADELPAISLAAARLTRRLSDIDSLLRHNQRELVSSSMSSGRIRQLAAGLAALGVAAAAAITVLVR